MSRKKHQEGDVVPVDQDGRAADLSVLKEANVAFDPTTQHLDLNKDEKRRVTAIMLAITAYRDLIIKDAEYLRTAADLAERGKGPALRPATIEGILDTAVCFDALIEGKHQQPVEETGRAMAQGKNDTKESE